MKKVLIFLAIMSLLHVGVNAQVADIATFFKIRDTRSVNDRPNFVSNAMRADLKLLRSIGIQSPNEFDYSTSLTVSPWGDSSCGFVHQLNFNDYGIYYRNATYSSSTWNSWKKLLIVDIDGNVGSNLGVNGNFLTKGKLAIAPNGMISDEKYNGHLVMTKPAASGQFINLIRAGNNIWSIGMIYNTSTFAISPGKKDDTQFTDPYFSISASGNVGIGALSLAEKLNVNGTIRAKEIKVDSEWADFVFEEDYQLPTLEEVARHIKEKKHLPDIPSAKEVEENGIGLGEMNAKLLQKIEELTLYTIQQQKLIENLYSEIEGIKSKK